MALVDHERVVLLLKARLAERDSWGRRQLSDLIRDLEVECARDEPPADTLWRLYGDELRDLFFNRVTPSSQPSDATASTADRAADGDVPSRSDRREADESAPEEEASWRQEQPLAAART